MKRKKKLIIAILLVILVGLLASIYGALNSGPDLSQEDKDKLYTQQGKIRPHLNGNYVIGRKTVLKDNTYIFIECDDSVEYDVDCWKANITFYANGSGYLIIPIFYHTITDKHQINFACRDYYVDLSHYNTEEELADIIAQCEEKINQVKFKIKEYESKIREEKMKKDF